MLQMKMQTYVMSLFMRNIVMEIDEPVGRVAVHFGLGEY